MYTEYMGGNYTESLVHFLKKKKQNVCVHHIHYTQQYILKAEKNVLHYIIMVERLI